MTQPTPNEKHERMMKMLKPALERVASDPEFRNRLETTPLAALAEMNVELDEDTRRELEGKRFSEFWALRQQAPEGPVGLRDLPPKDKDQDAVSGGFTLTTKTPLSPLSPTSPIRKPVGSFAPPYVPVGPSGDGDF